MSKLSSKPLFFSNLGKSKTPKMVNPGILFLTLYFPFPDGKIYHVTGIWVLSLTTGGFHIVVREKTHISITWYTFSTK